jgi:prepilin-type N-terminal cleavage/methylation domain-containing protein
MRHFLTEQNGYSLVEILIAVTIFSIGILAVAGMQISSMYGNAFSRNTTGAVTIAQDRIEQTMDLSFDHADLSAGNYTETQGMYNVAWTINDDVMAPNTKTIDVTLTWTQYGQPKTFQTRYVLADTD